MDGKKTEKKELDELVAQGRWVGTMADVGGRVREGKPPKLWSKLGT